MAGINALYEYIDEMVALQRKSVMEKKPVPELTLMFVELKNRIHILKCSECREEKACRK